jgi:hypothetical protein
MKLVRVASYRPPRYPTRAVLQSHPELMRVLPERWKSNPAVLAALGALLASGCCGRKGCSIKGKTGPTSTPTVAELPGPDPSSVPANPAVKVAPIFKHGAGVVSSGGMVGTRMVFLTEDEAIRVILDEAEKAGVQFKGAPRTLPNVEVPVTSLYASFGRRRNPKSKIPVARPKALTLDGTAPDKAVSFEFVSDADRAAWEDPGGQGSTVETHDLLGTALVLRDGLTRINDPGVFGVFYDPIAKFRERPAGELTEFTPSTLMPLRFLDSRNKLVNVTRTSDTAVTITDGRIYVMLTAGAAEASVDHKKVKLPTAVLKEGKELYVPVKFVVEKLGGTATWDSAKQRLSVQVTEADKPTTTEVRAETIGLQKASVAFRDWDREFVEEPTREAARQELRAQVRDFLGWLRGQGII